MRRGGPSFLVCVLASDRTLSDFTASGQHRFHLVPTRLE